MSRWVILWYYLFLVVVIILPLTLNHFFALGLDNNLVLMALVLVTAFNPFVFLWTRANDLNRYYGDQYRSESVQLAKTSDTSEALIKETRQQLQAKDRELEAKNLELSLANQRLQKL